MCVVQKFLKNLKAVDGFNQLLSRILLRSQESQDNLRAVDGLNQLLSGNSEKTVGSKNEEAEQRRPQNERTASC